ncbi:MAG: helix-turn-helix domain-containing protein [Nannocystaceae bacterium]
MARAPDSDDDDDDDGRVPTARRLRERSYMAELGQRVRALREERGLTQQSLAQAAGIATDMVSRLENGHYSSPGLRTLLRIALGMGTSVGALLPEACAAAARSRGRGLGARAPAGLRWRAPASTSSSSSSSSRPWSWRDDARAEPARARSGSGRRARCRHRRAASRARTRSASSTSCGGRGSLASRPWPSRPPRPRASTAPTSCS